MYAVDDLSDAIDVTREFLTPIRAGMWLRLVLVVFFISGAGIGGGTPPVGDIGMVADGPTVPVEEPTDPTGEPIDPEADFPLEELLLVGVVLLLVGFVIWLVFSILRAIMDFVFVESLRSSNVHVRRYARENLGRAGRLFLFRVIVGLLAFGPLVLGFFVVVFTADALEEVAFASLALLALLAIPIYLLYAIVMRFTTVFVVPIMLLEERTVLGGWKRFWPTFTANWTEYVVYLVLVWIIWVLVGIAIAFLAFFGVLLIGLPFGILAVIFAALLGPIGLVLAAVTLLAAFVLFLVYITLIEVPIYSYLRYYALLLLGDTDRELDLIPEQRAAVRGDGGRDEDGRWRTDEDERQLEEDDERADDGDDDDGWNNDDDGWNNNDNDDDGWDDESDEWNTSSDWDDNDDDRRW
ncbi:DUF975 family protein [Natronobeatus ordinarius]|uniref:DUF975 family protein n=1 Tax=Natronobeatus ordinarius TaxID=2963433 RepID=UPI0020CE2E3D|nr:DUF975 family protein [Natronobeatus ordinarius]